MRPTHARARGAWAAALCLLLGCRSAPQAPTPDATLPTPPPPTASPPESPEPRIVHVGALRGEKLPEATSWIALGDHSCYVTRAGSVKCLGDNDLGELGDGTNVPSVHPVRAGTMTDVASVAVADAVTCAVTRSGEVRCWGGQAKPINVLRSKPLVGPTLVAGLADVARLALTPSGGVCALHRDGHVSCLRRKDDPRGPPYGVPVTVPGLDATDLAAGSSRHCAVRRSGEIVCWDHRDDEDRIDVASLVPVPRRSGVAPGADMATVLALARDLSCAQAADGVIQCWRDRLGSQSTRPRVLSPVFTLGGLAPGTRLLDGASHACLGAPDDTVLCLEDGGDPADAPLRSRALSTILSKTTADLTTIAATDVAAPPGRVAGSPECAGSRPSWRCHYVWDGKDLKAASPAATPPPGAPMYVLPLKEIISVPLGSRTFLFSDADYMVRRQLVVRELVGGEAFVRGKILPAEPDPQQPDGDRYLHARYPTAFWIEGDIAHFVMSKRLF